MAFLLFLTSNDQVIIVTQDKITPVFSTIIEPVLEPFSNFDEPAMSTNPAIEIFDNFYCDECNDFANKTLPLIQESYVASGKVNLRIVLVPNMNDENQLAAVMAAKCAGEQDNFWDMYVKLHAAQEPIAKDKLVGLAKELEMDTEICSECMENTQLRNGIEADVLKAQEMGVTKKPVIFINEYQLIGNQPIENINKVLDEILSEL